MPQTYLLLCISAFLAGAINALAGGGTLLTFPVLIEGLRALQIYPEPVISAIANATSTVALLPASLSSALAYREELRVVKRWLYLLLAPSIVGGILGALLVTLFPEPFDTLVPWLILCASLLFIAQPLVAKWLRRQDQAATFVVAAAGAPQERKVLHVAEQPSHRQVAAVVLLQLVVAIYGGYFGAGIGILMLSALALMGLSNLHEMNAIKTVLGSCINGLAAAVFVLQDVNLRLGLIEFTEELPPAIVHWPFALAMTVSSIAGGYVGARYGKRLPSRYVRWFVIFVGLTLTAWYFSKPYLLSK